MTKFDPQALLDTPLNEIEPPKNLPDGSYIWNINSRKFGEMPAREVDGEMRDAVTTVEFEMTAVGYLPDVEEADVLEALNGKSLSDIKKRKNFWITPDAVSRLKDFCVNAGSATPDSTEPLREQIENCIGHQIVGMLKAEPSQKDPTKVYSNITTFAPVP